MKWWKKMAKKILEPEKSKTLMMWQQRYETAKSKYADELALMEVYDKYYIGDRHVKANPNIFDGDAAKLSLNVRNIVYELIESEVDSAIPAPKVTPIHPEDVEQAKKIEMFLNNEIQLQHMSVINDQQERTTPIQGGSFTLLDWDNSKGYHCTIGDLSLSDVHPRQIIPQEGITNLDEMDYWFIRTSQTKDYIKRHFDKDVSDECETDKDIRDGAENEDIVTVITAYYKNKDGGIGLYRWCGDVELESMEDYQARHLIVCKECGAIKTEDTCPYCGSKKFVERSDEMDIVPIQKRAYEGVTLDGTPIEHIIEENVEIPFYKPNVFPIVLRKNISRDRKFLGFSDVDAIKDQQDTVKKLGSNMNEKLLKGGSFVTLPSGVGLETTDEQLKIIRIDNPAQKALIDVITVQADTSQDRVVLEQNYSWAKSTLGITDAYQGKYDSSAQSGTAKQYSINQAAGRLESKRVMKNQAYAKIFEMMFKFALAYADQPIPINSTGLDGEPTFTHFDKKDFIKVDSAGQYYWNDEFIFSIDPTSTLLTNREAMWNQADLKLQSGAFGPIGDLRTNQLYWLEQEKNGYPHAGEILKIIEGRIAEEKQNVAAMQQMGGANEMPGM